MSGWRLDVGDARQLVCTLADESIDAVITDPPYGTTNMEWDTDVLDERMLAQFWRVLKPGGAIVVFACGTFTADMMVKWRKWYRYKWVWRRASVVGHLDAKRRPMRAHEDVLIFGRALPKYWPVTKPGVLTRKVYTKSRLYGGQNATGQVGECDLRYPNDVVDAASPAGKQRIHVTEKPVELLSLLVRSYTAPSPDVTTVLDPFCGSGSCGEACIRTGRRFVGFEQDAVMAAQARSRLERAGEMPLFAAPSRQMQADLGF